MRRAEVDVALLPFAPDLVPLMDHELVRERDPGSRNIILGQKLHSYKRFTAHLELRAVIPACSMLGLNRGPIDIEPQASLDALKIATDEAHHAYCAEDLKRQLTEIIGIPPHVDRDPEFLARMAAELDVLPPDMKDLGVLTFACVSETLITSSLTQIPTDLRVLPAVRAVILDHARDEAKHHAYFSYIMDRMWGQLTPGEKDVVGPLFATFILAFLSPDLVVELDWLEAGGFERAEAKRIIEETVSSHDYPGTYRDASKPTIDLMTRFGMLEHAATRDALSSAGLIG
jgi:P-aminobenzoate N-oxygenase AurF